MTTDRNVPDAGQPDRLRTALRATVVLVLLGLITHSTYAGSGDEPHYLAIAHSAAFDFDLDVANNYGAGEPLIAGGGLQPENHVRPGVGGVARPVHDIGMPLLFAPVSRVLVPLTHWAARTIPEGVLRRLRVTPTVMYRHGMSAAMIALAVVLASLMFDAFLRLGVAPRTALAACLIALLSPPLLIQSVLFFTELPSALLAFFVFGRLAVPGAPPPVGGPGGASARRWLLLGAATGLLLFVHARNAGLVLALAALGLAAAWKQAAPGGAMAFGLGLAVPVAVRTAVTYWFWGTLLTTPHAAFGAPAGLAASASETWTRLAGMLVDQEFGLLPYAPIYGLAAVGLVAMPDRGLARHILFVCACYLVVVLSPITNVHGWTGGWSPPARFLAPIVPLLALALPFAVRAVPRVLLTVLVAVQVGINAYMWQHPKDLWNDGDGTAAVCSRAGRTFCRYLPSLVEPGTTPAP